LLAALHVLVLVQLVPWPPAVLRLVSPGSFAFYDRLSLVPLAAWHPVSVNPADTARGLCFLAGMSLLYVAVFREFHEERWRRRLVAVVVAAGAVLAVVGLLQAASLAPTRIYGLWRPRWDWGVFGPYVSKNHYAGYMVMAVPLALAFAAEALLALRAEWRARRVGWVALGGASGNALVRRAALALLIVVGLLAAQSRGGLAALAVAVLALPLALRHRRAAAAVVLGVVLAAVGWMAAGGMLRGLETRGLRSNRLALWADAARLVKDFPLLGAGFNAFGSAYVPYQRVDTYEWYGEAHNEYLQALVDTGLVGALLTAALLVTLFRRALRAARLGPLDAGCLAGLLALCAHNLVEFNWQVPANAATFVALAALAARRGAPEASGWGAIALTPPDRRA
ncbi:MAG TPA: O-antigen ligase family protein, partial [Vicinamibacteria bacterium]|nr:O-antigen ligase family protein [Vicinamibacteria bacterium]